jgi:hypothetical protein
MALKWNDLYKAGKYEQAIDAYGSVLKTDQHSSNCILTLGIATIN